jgi:hypothetical protein
LAGDKIGGNREVKKAVEAYWGGKISADELTKVAADVKKTSWASIKSHGVDHIPRSASCYRSINDQRILISVKTAVNFLFTIMFSIILLRLTLFQNVISAWDCLLWTFILPWDVGARLKTSTCLLPR